MRLRKWIRYPLMTMSLAICIGTGIKVVRDSCVQAKETIAVQDLKENVFLETSEQSFPFTTATYESCKQINDDFIGWLSFENQSISEPIVQGENNAFYLNHWIDGSENAQGTIFLSAHNDLKNDRNLTLYGHRVFYLDEAKFSPLMQYQSQAYYEENPNFQVWLEKEVVTYEIVAVYEQNIQESFGTSMSQYSKDAFTSYHDVVQQRNLVQPKSDFLYEDHLMTLQTCAVEGGKVKLICLAKQIQKDLY